MEHQKYKECQISSTINLDIFVMRMKKKQCIKFIFSEKAKDNQ